MLRPTIGVTLVATALAVGGALAQGLQTEGAIDAIVGSEVREQESTASADHGKILEAIDKAGENAEAVRKVTDVKSVDIVFLSDAAVTEGGPPSEIDAKLKERDAEITSLRQEIEGNALLFHAIDSRQVLMRDVLGIEIGDDKRVVVYAAAKPAG
ncbi:MAG: hypothetical protein KF914_04915 [Rhizobiaceae bacterium]|nr:hypothetical protein [Rhizobiaceae bacterium]MBX3573432.1 hypothetical protein [Mesorhizobium sp.]